MLSGLRFWFISPISHCLVLSLPLSLSNYLSIYMHSYIYIYIYIYVCVCVCVCVNFYIIDQIQIYQSFQPFEDIQFIWLFRSTWIWRISFRSSIGKYMTRPQVIPYWKVLRTFSCHFLTHRKYTSMTKGKVTLKDLVPVIFQQNWQYTSMNKDQVTLKARNPAR